MKYKARSIIALGIIQFNSLTLHVVQGNLSQYQSNFLWRSRSNIEHLVILCITGGGAAIGKLRVDVVGTSDEDSINDNASVISLASDTTVVEEGKNQ